MTVEELTVRVARDAFERGHDQAPVNDTYAKWCACVSLWGADSPPSLGCLLAMVREAWGMPGMYVQHRGGVTASVDAWLVVGPEKLHITGPTETGALVAALEAAPQVAT